MTSTPRGAHSRRRVLAAIAGCGVGTATFQRTLAVMVEQEQAITPEMIASAEWVCEVEFSERERVELAADIARQLEECRQLRAVELDDNTPPALTFLPELQPRHVPSKPVVRVAAVIDEADVKRPPLSEDVAFLPVSRLSQLVRDGRLGSVELTKIYLARLERYDPLLKCVVTRTEDLAMRQARRADEEIAAGRYRGPLHGIPWGAKDLISVPGYPTTWGAPQYREQTRGELATVAARLEAAGAVLVAKLSLGNLALGDKWFGGMTRNPWNPDEGSSGSSAGSAAAVVAGLVGFAIGSETLGSIISPCRRCGATGLRPTFGRVSRFGCMPLSWSMDKLGPIVRSVEDAALVLAAIHGSDGHDPSAVDRPFSWPSDRPVDTLRAGYIEDETPRAERAELQTLEELGVQLKPIRLPHRVPARALTLMLDVEAASMFDALTRTRNLDGLHVWPRVFRRAQLIPAVEYVRAARARTLLMREMKRLFEDIDFYVGGNDLAICNMTGHPTVIVPNGFVEREGRTVPTSLTFTGRLYEESTLLAAAHAFQVRSAWHERRPPLEAFLAAPPDGSDRASP